MKIKQIFNVPNSITIARIFLLITALILFEPFTKPTPRIILAATLFSLVSFSDWFDGYFARKLNQVTTLGKILDPTVDRLVFIFGTLKMLQIGIIPIPIAYFILAREIVISTLALVFMVKAKVEVEVSQLGKIGAFAFFVYLPGLSIYRLIHFTPYTWLIYASGVVGVVLSSISLLQYLYLFFKKSKVQ